jgi:transcriptional regulator with GAF, ATPase, and Fis domain
MLKNRLEGLRGRHLREEEILIRGAMDANGWIQARAARWLGCPPTSLARAIRRHPTIIASVEKRLYGSI